MRVRVDHVLCEANAVCVRLVPEVFALGDDDRLQIKPGPADEALRSRLAEAVRRCPKQALALVEGTTELKGDPS
jgi:ferredoxin